MVIWHEIGHAVVANYEGLNVTRVSVDLSNFQNSETAYSGGEPAQIENNPTFRPARVALAGVVSESIFLYGNNLPEVINSSFQLLRDNTAGNDRNRLTQILNLRTNRRDSSAKLVRLVQDDFEILCLERNKVVSIAILTAICLQITTAREKIVLSEEILTQIFKNSRCLS